MKPQTPQGIITRSKEHQTTGHSNKKPNESSSYPVLKKFDDFYKERKNLQNEMYVYQPPRVDRTLYQVDLSKITKEVSQPPLNKKYEYLSKVSKEDLDYYMKFIEYYDKKAGNDNIYLRGVHSVEERALTLLKSCGYDINMAMSKVLFPVMDRLNCLDHSKKDKSLYLTSALNELIGANAAEKEEWIKFMIGRLNKKIGLEELEIYKEKGKKMKIEIPSIIESEKKCAMLLSKKIKQYLAEKNNTINEIKHLYEISRTYKVQTIEFSSAGDLINKAENWKTRVKEIEKQCVPYKTLQTLYNEGKALPFKFEGNIFEDLKDRFERAQEWHRLFNCLPKHSKTRQQGSAQVHRSTLECLKKMLDTANIVNFTSSEVECLKKNYELLDEAEKKIKESFKDPKIEKTKELLQEYLNTLDCLRFTTSLYDEIEDELALIEWKEKKESLISGNKQGNNTLKGNKMKNLLHLIKFADQKQLCDHGEITEFKTKLRQIEIWINKVSLIFNDNELMINDDYKDYNSDEFKISFNELYELYDQGKTFEFIPEECEYLLGKCEECFAFVEKCQRAINDPSGKQDLNKFNELSEQMSNYNIYTVEFDYIKDEIQSVKTWKEEAETFIAKYKSIDSLLLSLKDLVNLSNRKSNLNAMEMFLRLNKVCYENLIELEGKVPSLAINSPEYLALERIKTISEQMSKKDIESLTTLEGLCQFIIDCQKACVPKAYFASLIKKYRGNSWSEFASSEKRMPLSEAEGMLKEADSLKMNFEQVSELKDKVFKTKEWLRAKKKMLLSDKISYTYLDKLVEEGRHLPLSTNEFTDIEIFKEGVDNEKEQISTILSTKHNYEEIIELTNKMNRNIIDNDEYDVIKKLRNVCDSWNEIANKIITSRQLCQLYFKRKKNNSNENNNNINKIANSEIDIDENKASNKSQENNKSELEQSSHKESDEDNQLDDNKAQSFLGRKRKQETPIARIANADNESDSDLTHPPKMLNPDDILSKYQNTQLTLSECESLLILINPNSNQKIANQKLSSMDKTTAKKFLNFTNEERYDFLNKRLVLKEDTGEQYCICRKGDDSINYMIQCENCKGWFHGKCIKIQTATADSINQYLCICCSKRKDSTASYNYEFDSMKRRSYEFLIDFIAEGESIMATFPQMEALYIIKQKAEYWKEKYIKTLSEVLSYYKSGKNCLNDTLDTALTTLYLESQGFCVEIKNESNIMLILKQSDWFKETYKCIDGKKNSEKNLKKLLSSSYCLFDWKFITTYNDIEKQYFDVIVPKGVRALIELGLINQKSGNNISTTSH